MYEKLQVCALCQDDYPEWKILWDGYHAFYGRHGETALAPELTQMAWSRFFENNEPVHALVAVEAGQVVGIAHYLFHRNIRKYAPDCYLQDLFTAETARGKGVGRALILAVAQQATQTGSDLYWHTHLENTRARALYDQVARHSGFIVYSKT